MHRCRESYNCTVAVHSCCTFLFYPHLSLSLCVCLVMSYANCGHHCGHHWMAALTTSGFKPQALDGHLCLQFRGACAPQTTWDHRMSQDRVIGGQMSKLKPHITFRTTSERSSMPQPCKHVQILRKHVQISVCPELIFVHLQRLLKSRPLYIGIAHLRHKHAHMIDTHMYIYI